MRKISGRLNEMVQELQYNGNIKDHYDREDYEDVFREREFGYSYYDNMIVTIDLGLDL